MKKILFLIAISCVAWACSNRDYKEGDMVFQISKSKQSPFVALATGSVYTHCGLTCYALGTGDATLDRYYRTLDWYERVYSSTD